MEIERIVKYRVGTQEFDSHRKAVAHVEELISQHAKQMVLAAGGHMKSCIPLTEYLLINRKALAELLSVDTDFPKEDE